MSKTIQSIAPPFEGGSVILPDGRFIPMDLHRKINNLPGDKIARHFTAREFECTGKLLVALPLLWLLDEFRELAGPTKINSGYRTPEKQMSLREAGYKTATNSPHCYGMAADIDTESWEETKAKVELLKQAAKNASRKYGIEIKMRWGYRTYWQTKQQTFIHVDICPMYFAPGAPFHDIKHKEQHEFVNSNW